MSIRALQWFLIAGCIAGLVSAITGVDAFSFDTVSGSQISHYSTVWGRGWGVAMAFLCALGAWGIHRRAAIVWPLGWAALIVGSVWFVVQVAIMLLPQPSGWVGLMGVVVGVIIGVGYWGVWWQRHREYFSPGGTPADWRPDLAPLRWFGIGLVALAAIFLLAALLASMLHK